LQDIREFAASDSVCSTAHAHAHVRVADHVVDVNVDEDVFVVDYVNRWSWSGATA